MRYLLTTDYRPEIVQRPASVITTWIQINTHPNKMVFLGQNNKASG